jgi:hypothetical protein
MPVIDFAVHPCANVSNVFWHQPHEFKHFLGSFSPERYMVLWAFEQKVIEDFVKIRKG